ncbi:MAG: flagellar brake protein [Moraxellaceae bacterium]|nr:flagellar brake protein [Moraxellaceae bacterium]
MTETQQPAPRFELLQADNLTQYLLSERREIAFVLRQLAHKRSLVTAYYGQQERFLTTSVIGVSEDERWLLLDVARDEALNAEALLAERVLCITQLDKVKVQFAVSKLQRTEADGLPALRAPLPENLLRLQRREYYRLHAPTSHALSCTIPLPDGGRMEARVVDISGGGLAVIVPPAGTDLAPDMVFENCRIDLPDFGPVTTKLRVRNLFRLTSRSGVVTLRAGCQFEDLSTPMANAIQRYILRVERERKARDSGL